MENLQSIRQKDMSDSFSASDSSAFATASVGHIHHVKSAFLKNRMHSMTANILDTYTRCNPNFRVVDKLPQRMLTNPSEGVANDGCDNEEANLICHVHDQITCSDITYTILDLLGTGTFGQVFRCQKDSTKEVVAIKIIKNKAAYHSQGLLEIKIARLLNNTFDPKDERHIVRLLDSFEFNNHICLVFELLSVSLLDILTQNQFRGLPLSVVQRFTRQIIAAMVTLEDANIIHCDLKPENILLTPPKVQKMQAPPPTNKRSDNPSDISHDRNSKSQGSSKRYSMSSETTVEQTENSQSQKEAKLALTPPPSLILSSGSSSSDTTSAPSSSSAISEDRPQGQTQAGPQGGRLNVLSDVKVIDLGSACFEGRTMYSYIQSRFYRSPEVLLGVPYNGAIDMWSLACVCAEMYLGLPLFPGVSQHNQLTRIIEMMGCPPDSLIEGKNGSKYFSKIVQSPFGSRPYESNGLLSGLAHISTIQPSTDDATKDPWSNTPQTLSQPKYRIKTAEEYASETNTEIPVLRKYLRYSKLNDVIMKCPLANKSRMTPEQKKEEVLKRLCFLNFLEGLFQMNPFERWTAKQAANHPFITNAVFTGQFVPPLDPKINERKLLYLMQSENKDSRMRGGKPHLGNMAMGQGLNRDNLHMFQMLHHRRQSEPVGLNNSNLTSSGMYNHVEEGPLLMRGVSVIESRGSLDAVPGQYRYNSLPDTNSNDYLQQQQRYLHSQQAQQGLQIQQQQQQLVQSPPEQYSAYSAATPDEAWASYMMKDRASKEQAHPTLKKNNNQLIDGLVRAHPQSQLQSAGMIRSYASSCDDLSLTSHSNTNRRRKDNYDLMKRGSYFTGNSGENRDINNTTNYLQQQQRQQNISGGQPYPSNTRSNIPSTQSRQDYSKQIQNQQNSQNYPQSYQHGQRLQQSQSMDNIHPQWLQQQQNDNRYPSNCMQQSSRHNYDPANQSRIMSGSMDSTEKVEYGGSLTDVPLMMTDFGQALMRPELDERRRLHSQQQEGSGYNDQHYPNNQGGQRNRQQKNWSQQNSQNITRLQLSQQQSRFSLQQQHQNQQNQHSAQSNRNNFKNDSSYNYSLSQEMSDGRMLMEASVREHLRFKGQAAGSLDRHRPSSLDLSDINMSGYRGGDRGEDPSSRVSFALPIGESPDQTQNFVAQLVRRESSTGSTRENSPKNSDDGRRSAGSTSPSPAVGNINGMSQKSKVDSSSSIPTPKGQVGEVSESLADWDPFFSGDFEMEEQDDIAGNLVKTSRSGSAAISDRGSTDDGDNDVDEYEWRSTGSRGNSADVGRNSADVSRTPEIPTSVN